MARRYAACEAVRGAVGDGYPLMLDATWAYDYPTALRVGRAIQDLDFYSYEDPLAKWHIDGYVKLRQNLHIPLLATELPAGGLDQYSPWLLAEATDYLRGDVWLKGGTKRSRSRESWDDMARYYQQLPTD